LHYKCDRIFSSSSSIHCYKALPWQTQLLFDSHRLFVFIRFIITVNSARSFIVKYEF
jgi:hypothetical protein